jgi:hypothetical protein
VQGDEFSFVLTRHWRKLGLNLDEADFSNTQAIAAIARITGGSFSYGGASESRPRVRPRTCSKLASDKF